MQSMRMWPLVTNFLLDTQMIPAKIEVVKLIEMLFGVRFQLCPKKHVLDRDLYRKGHFEGTYLGICRCVKSRLV